MTDTDDPQHRVYHQHDADRITVREEIDDEDGVMTVRMPLASTGDVRNEGDDPLTRAELEGMARQINEGVVPAFLDHGSNMDVGGTRYGAAGKMGEWEDAEVDFEASADDEDLLMASVRAMDPETLPAATGALREALAAIKSQLERDMSIASSIGWRDDGRSPGGVDLMEGSIVGVQADPRTVSQDAAVALARAARDANPEADPEALVDSFRAVVMGPDDAGSEARDTMTDTDTDQSGDDPDNTTDAQDGMDAAEFRETMLELQRQQTETLSTLAADLRENDDDDDDDEDDDDDDEEGEQASDDPDNTQADDGDDSDVLTVDGEEFTADDVRALHDDLGDAEPDTDPDGERDADDEQPTDHDANPKNLL